MPTLEQPASRFYKLSHVIEDVGGRLTYIMSATFRDLDGSEFEVTWQHAAVKAAFQRPGFIDQLGTEGRARLRNKLIDILDKGRYSTRVEGRWVERSVKGLRSHEEAP